MSSCIVVVFVPINKLIFFVSVSLILVLLAELFDVNGCALLYDDGILFDDDDDDIFWLLPIFF